MTRHTRQTEILDENRKLRAQLRVMADAFLSVPEDMRPGDVNEQLHRRRAAMTQVLLADEESRQAMGTSIKVDNPLGLSLRDLHTPLWKRLLGRAISRENVIDTTAGCVGLLPGIGYALQAMVYLYFLLYQHLLPRNGDRKAAQLTQEIVSAIGGTLNINIAAFVNTFGRLMDPETRTTFEKIFGRATTEQWQVLDRLWAPAPTAAADVLEQYSPSELYLAGLAEDDVNIDVLSLQALADRARAAQQKSRVLHMRDRGALAVPVSTASGTVTGGRRPSHR